MKINLEFKLVPAATMAFLAGMSLGAQTNYVNTFDVSSSPLRYDFGNAITPTVTSATNDAGGSPLGGYPNSGSAELNWNWNYGTQGAGGAAFTGDFIYPAANYVGATVSFDIYVDPSSTPGGYNDYGYFQVNTRYTDGYAYGPSYVNSGIVPNLVSTTGQWGHVSFVLGSEASTLRALTFQDYNDSGRQITGPMHIYIDNVRIVPAAGTNLAQLLPINGTGTFVKGANLPWLDGQYDHDISLNPLHPSWGCAYNAAHMNQYLADLHNMGITVVRLWLNENKQGLQLDNNGNVTGLDPTFLNNLDNIIQLATQNGIFLYLTLNQGDSDWVTNTTKQASYINYAVIPMATRYKGNQHIFAYDVMNEIDGVVGGPLGNYGSGASWAQAQAYITATVSAIHSADPGRLATCSTGWHQWYNLNFFLGLGLDFYDYHNYQDSPSFPAVSSLAMDKPVYIGECGQSTTYWDDSIQNTCELDALNSARSGGYAGVGIWAYQYPGCSDHFSMVNTDGSWRPVCYTIQNWNYQVTINIQLSGKNLLLTWPQGTLLESTNITGPWVTNSAVSPYTVFPTNAYMFFRVKL